MNSEDPDYLMTFNDFCALYLVFKEQKDEEMIQVMFQMVRVSPQHIANKTPLEQEAALPAHMQAQKGKLSENRQG